MSRCLHTGSYLCWEVYHKVGSDGVTQSIYTAELPVSHLT